MQLPENIFVCGHSALISMAAAQFAGVIRQKNTETLFASINEQLLEMQQCEKWDVLHFRSFIKHDSDICLMNTLSGC